MSRCEFSAWALRGSLRCSVEKPNSELSSQCQNHPELSGGLSAREAEIRKGSTKSPGQRGSFNLAVWEGPGGPPPEF